MKWGSIFLRAAVPAILATANVATADTLCTQSVRVDRTLRGKKTVEYHVIKVLVGTGQSCPRGYSSVLDSSGQVANIASRADIQNIANSIFDAKRPTLTKGDQGVQGPVGPQGPIGPVGPKGEQGPAGNSGVSRTLVACSDPAVSPGQISAWAGCGAVGKATELFCLTKGLPGRVDVWTKTNYLSGIVIDEYDATSDKIRCMNAGAGTTVKACARCFSDSIPDIREPSSFDFTVPGTYTWQVPKGAKSVTVEAIGAGGGGGGSDSGKGDSAGGGGGAYAMKFINSPASGTSFTVTVGAGGLGGVVGNGQQGGITQIIAPNIAIGSFGGGGGQFANNNSVRIGGAGGTAFGGDFMTAGHKGEDFSTFPNGDGGVSGFVMSNVNLRCQSYANASRCKDGYQDNNPGDIYGNSSGLDFYGHAGIQGDSAGADGYAPGNGGSPSRHGLVAGRGGNGAVYITVGY